MFITIITAATRFCSTLALVSCAAPALDIPAQHPAAPGARSSAPAPELSAATLSPAVYSPSPLVAAHAADAHPHDHTGHVHHAAQSKPASEADAPAAENEKGGASSWTCPMHPEIVRSEAGSCPICGMHLVEKKAPPPGGQK